MEREKIKYSYSKRKLRQLEENCEITNNEKLAILEREKRIILSEINGIKTFYEMFPMTKQNVREKKKDLNFLKTCYDNNKLSLAMLNEKIKHEYTIEKIESYKEEAHELKKDIITMAVTGSIALAISAGFYVSDQVQGFLPLAASVILNGYFGSKISNESIELRNNIRMIKQK